MATGFSFTMLTAPFEKEMALLADAADKPTMYALRATGRYVQQTAKEQVPVYHGTDPRAEAESGNLKKSIRNAKRITRSGNSYSLKTGPFGTSKSGTQVISHGMRGGFAIDSLTAKHLGIKGPSMKAGEYTKGQVRGVLLYRSVQEVNYGYMAYGTLAAQGGMRGVYEAAYAKAFARFAR